MVKKTRENEKIRETKKVKKEKVKTKDNKEKINEGEFKRFVPIPECVGKSFQIDDYGNFRIVVDDKESDWVDYQGIATLSIGEKLYIGVSDYFKGCLPTECVLKAEKRDDIHKKEDEGFVKVKIVDKNKNEPLDMEDIEHVLEGVFLEREFSVTVESLE